MNYYKSKEFKKEEITKIISEAHLKWNKCKEELKEKFLTYKGAIKEGVPAEVYQYHYLIAERNCKKAKAQYKLLAHYLTPILEEIEDESLGVKNGKEN